MRDVVGIVLCGGASRRMGRSKADLPFGPETLLQRAARQLLEAVDRVIVAAAPGQPLPPLDARRARIVRDPSPHPGPLRGLAAALADLGGPGEFAYLAAVDAPHFHPAWPRLLRDRIGDHDAAAAVVDGRLQPFAALYRIAPAREAASRLLAEGPPRLTALLDRLDARRIERAEYAAIDPTNGLFRDLDRPDEYREALDEAASKGWGRRPPRRDG